MSTYQKGQPVWVWRVTWNESHLDTDVIHGTVREEDDTGIQLLPDGARADPKNTIRCTLCAVATTREGAHKKLAEWLHSEFKERADTMHDLQKEICAVAAPQALNNDKMFWLAKKQKKGLTHE